MITNPGKNVIKKVFAGQTPQIADYIGFGVGSSAASINSTALDFQVVRASIDSIGADLANNRIVFMASIEPGLINKVYEMGLFSSTAYILPDVILNVLAPRTAMWTNGTLVETNARAGSKTLKVDYVANGTTNAELLGLAEDFSSLVATDLIKIAFFAGSNLSSVRIRMGTDSSNYYEFAITSGISAGYNIVNAQKGSAAKVGAPDWANISYVAIRPSATSGGSGSIFLDGIKFEKQPLVASDILVSRYVLPTPLIVDADIATEVEYSLGIDIA